MRRVERLYAGALALLMHAVLLWTWPHLIRSQRETSTPGVPPISVRLLPSVAAPAEPSRPLAHASVRAPAKSAKANATGTAPSIGQAVAITAPTIQDAAGLAASTPAPLDLHLRLPPGAAERGALTEPANSMRRLALNDPRSNAHGDPTQKLPDDIAAAAKGDCLKGEFFTPFNGLLALPFLAYAAASGHCKPQR